jgi:hypothetical protein
MDNYQLVPSFQCDTQDKQTMSVSVRDVQAALNSIASQYPELSQAMTVTNKMLIRLDTIRDEAKLLAGHVNGVRELCGQWGEKHEFDIPRVVA